MILAVALGVGDRRRAARCSACTDASRSRRAHARDGDAHPPPAAAPAGPDRRVTGRDGGAPGRAACPFGAAGPAAATTPSSPSSRSRSTSSASRWARVVRPFQAVAVAARWSPPRLAIVLGEIGRATAIGASFDDALVAAGADAPNVRPLDRDAAHEHPARFARIRRRSPRLAQEVRADVRRRAEARARTVPVRLLFPLVFCVLPAFALLTVVPVLLDGIAF